MSSNPKIQVIVQSFPPFRADNVVIVMGLVVSKPVGRSSTNPVLDFGAIDSRSEMPYISLPVMMAGIVALFEPLLPVRCKLALAEHCIVHS